MNINIGDLLAIQIEYDVPERKYHRWSHIQKMFSNANEYDLCLSGSQQLAIIFHDLVCVPGQCGLNEFHSAILADKYIRKNNACVNSETVKLCISSTIGHIPLCDEAAVVVDLDVLILASDLDEYWSYSKAIREEHSFLSEELWVKGRVKFLEEMLKRKNLFLCSCFLQLNKNAHENISYELDMLKKTDVNEIGVKELV